ALDQQPPQAGTDAAAAVARIDSEIAPVPTKPGHVGPVREADHAPFLFPRAAQAGKQQVAGPALRVPDPLAGESFLDPAPGNAFFLGQTGLVNSTRLPQGLAPWLQRFPADDLRVCRPEGRAKESINVSGHKALPDIPPPARATVTLSVVAA